MYQNISLKCFILSKLLHRIGDMPGSPMVYDGHAFNLQGADLTV